MRCYYSVSTTVLLCISAKVCVYCTSFLYCMWPALAHTYLQEHICTCVIIPYYPLDTSRAPFTHELSPALCTTTSPSVIHPLIRSFLHTTRTVLFAMRYHHSSALLACCRMVMDLSMFPSLVRTDSASASCPRPHTYILAHAPYRTYLHAVYSSIIRSSDFRDRARPCGRSRT